MRTISTAPHAAPLLLLAALLLTALAGCNPAKSDKPVVTVSIAPQKWLVEQIAGDRLEVKALLGQGANPESYEPAMSHLLNLEQSRIYFTLGNLGFEEAIIQKVKASKPGLRIACITEGIEPIHGTHSHPGHSHDEGASCPDGGDGGDGAIDPHTWSSVANARIMAGNILERLIEIDPEGESSYRSRHAELMQRLDSLDGAIRATLAGAPGVRDFLVWHPSLSYFARDYGLNQIALSRDDKELATPDVRSRLDHARSHGPGLVLLLQRDIDPRQAATITAETGARTAYINPLNPDWPGEMLATARAIAGVEP